MRVTAPVPLSKRKNKDRYILGATNITLMIQKANRYIVLFFPLFNKIFHHVHDPKRIPIADKTFCVMVSLRVLNWTNIVSKMGLRTHYSEPNGSIFISTFFSYITSRILRWHLFYHLFWYYILRISNLVYFCPFEIYEKEKRWVYFYLSFAYVCLTMIIGHNWQIYIPPVLTQRTSATV